MIWQALRQKFRDRGPLAFAADTAQLAGACIVIGGWSAILFTAAVGGTAVGLTLAALDGCGHRARGVCTCVNSFDECRCGRGVRP